MDFDAYWQKIGDRDYPYLKEKLEVIKFMLPKGVTTILDVGCGAGQITNALHGYDITGTDISTEGLKYIHGKTIQASATDLPFPDGSFDLVMANELLEHLTSDEMQKALWHFKRITRRYILISIPNSEKLETRMTRCSCGNVFHIYGHLQSLDASDVSDGCKVLRIEKCGCLDDITIGWITNIKHRISHEYFSVDGFDVTCPKCGAMITKPALWRRGLGFGLVLLERMIVMGKKGEPDWQVILMEVLK